MECETLLTMKQIFIKPAVLQRTVYAQQRNAGVKQPRLFQLGVFLPNGDDRQSARTLSPQHHACPPSITHLIHGRQPSLAIAPAIACHQLTLVGKIRQPGSERHLLLKTNGDGDLLQVSMKTHKTVLVIIY